MRRYLYPVLLLCLPCMGLTQTDLRVSDNQRYLVKKTDGQPFFWLGDTAWELFHRLTREEAAIYLQKRAEQGFTVVQAVALAELDGLNDPNPYGQLPLLNNDPTRPNDAYFQHVDWVVKKAAELGIYIALLPTWGDKVFKDKWGNGPEIFTPENARVYGQWIGNRYRNQPNIIWVLGGDRNPRNANDLTIWRAMADGIEAGVGSAQTGLMTFHPQPNDIQDGGSSKWFQEDKWLDFNMFQTGHCRENRVWDLIKVAYDKQPTKPVLDGETIYEDHPVCFNARDLGISSAYDVRKHAWLDVFAGAFGHTYGCHDIWQMYTPKRLPVNGPNMPWYIALDLPGANQMRHLRNLIMSRPMLDRIPDQSLIVDARAEHDHIQATRGKNYAFIYSSQGREIGVNMGKIDGKQVEASWYNPRSGETKTFQTLDNKGIINFTPPTNGYGQDWVLILDGK